MNAIRNFLYGFGSIIAIQPPRGRNPLIEAPRRTTDRQAIAGDWKRVGDDLRRVLRSEQTRHRGQ